LDYTFVRPLGKGRFGKVGLYRHKRGVHHAIKKVPLTPYSFDEFRALIAACRHRARMVDLKKVFIVNNTVFLVMEPLSRELTQREFDHLPYNMRHQKLPEFDLDDRREENMMVRKGHDGGFDQVVHIDLGVLDGFGYARLLGALEQAAIEFQSLAGRLGLQPAYRPELESVTPPFGDGGDPRSGR
jgi:hypothetical protein